MKVFLVVLITSLILSILSQYWLVTVSIIVFLGFVMWEAAIMVNRITPLTSKYDTPFGNWCKQTVEEIINNMSTYDKYDMTTEINNNINSARHNLDKKNIKY